METPVSNLRSVSSTSLVRPQEYTIVVCGDDDEPTGRSKILDKFNPDREATESCRQTVDINGIQCVIELVEFESLETDKAMLQYHVQYADAFVFVFSRFSPPTLDTAQRHHDVVMRAANAPGLVRDQDELSFFLIGNADKDLPVINSNSREELKETQRTNGKLMAQRWACPYLEVDTSEDEFHGVHEAIECIGQAIKSTEKEEITGVSYRKTKAPQRFLFRRMLGRFVG